MLMDKETERNQIKVLTEMWQRILKKYFVPSSNEIENNKGTINQMETTQSAILERDYIVRISDSTESREINLKSNLTFDEAVKVAELNLFNEALSKIAVNQLQDKLKQMADLVDKLKETKSLMPILLEVTQQLDEARKENDAMNLELKKMKTVLLEKYGLNFFDDIESEKN